MAFTKKENNIFFIALLITVAVIPLVAIQNIDCNGKAFYCVNSTHFKICVDLGGGISTTVDDFVIPCPKNTECKGSNYFECEYIATTTFKPVQKSEVSNDISVTPLLKNIDLATNSYNKTSDNKLLVTVVSTIPTSTLEFIDLTSEGALQNVGSDFSDSDRLRENTILEASTANEELTSTTFTKVTIDNIESNDTIKNNSDFKINNITDKEIINALPNLNLSISFNENSKTGNIGNSSNIFIESTSNYNALNDKDYGITNNEQLQVPKFQIAIFDKISNTTSIDYTTEIAQSNTKYILNGASTENNITLVSHNKTTNSNFSFININNLTETEISAELVKNNETIIDATIELSFSSIKDNVSTSELHINNGPSKVLSEKGKAVKYTATDINIFYDNSSTITTQAEISDAMSISNVKNSTSKSIYQTTQGPNMNYTTVDMLQNREKSTINVIKTFNDTTSPDNQLIITEAYNVTSKTLKTSNINFESQIKQESTTNDSMLLEHSILNLNSTESNNNLANFSLPTIYSLKTKENRITEMEPPPKLEEFGTQSDVLKENSNFNIDIFRIEPTESIPKTTYIYTSLKDQNLYPNPTLYEKEFVDSTIQLKSDDSLKFKITIQGDPYTLPMDNTNENTEPTNGKNKPPSEALVRDITTKVDITTTNNNQKVDITTKNNYEEVTSVPTNLFLNAEKNTKTVESDMSHNVYEIYSEKLNSTQSSFHYLSNHHLVTHKNIELKETSTINPLEISDVTFVSLSTFDIEPRKNITNAKMEVQTVNYNMISQAHNMNDKVVSDAIIVKTNSPNETVIENKNEPVNTSLIQSHVKIIDHTDINIQKHDATIKKLDENINNNHTDKFIAAHNNKRKLKLPDLNMTKNFDVRLYNVKETGIHIKQNDDVQKLATTNVVEVMNYIGTTQLISNIIRDKKHEDKQTETENIEKREQLISSTTEMGNLNEVNITEMNFKTFENTNDIIVNFVSNQTLIGINITKESNIQNAKNFNDTKQMYINSNDLQITTTDETFTIPLDIDTTVSIFSDLDITTEVYNSTEYNNPQNIINDTKINDYYNLKMFTLTNSDIINPTVAAEVVLPTEIFNKDSNKQIQSNSDTLINVSRNLKINPHSEANKQTNYNTKLSENSTKRNITEYKVNITEINFKTFENANDTIVNFVNNQTPIGINITKENNIQNAKYFNDTKQMYINSNDLQITTTDETFTIPFDIDTTVSIFSDLDYITEVYNSTEYNNPQNIINNTKIHDYYNLKMFTLNISDIINPTVAAEIVLPTEIINKDSNKQIQSNNVTLINVTRNIYSHSEANKQTNYNTKHSENSTKRNTAMLADLNINEDIFEETKGALPLNNFDNTAATVIDHHNLDVQLHITKDNKEIVQTSYNIETSALNSNDNTNIVNGSNYFNKQVSNNSTFIDDSTATDITINASPNINVQKNFNGAIDEIKMKQVDDMLKGDINSTKMHAKEMELKYNKTVDNDRSLDTSGIRNEYNKTITNNIILTLNISMLNNTDNNANILSRNSSTYLKDNAIKVQEPYENNDMTKTKVTLTLTESSITDIRNESMNIQSQIQRPTLNISNFNYSNIKIKTYNNGVKEENKDTNYKNVSAVQMMQHVNEKIRADNLSTTSTITKNIPTLPPFSSQTNPQNINETYNKNRDSNISSPNINLTTNLENLNKAVNNNSVTPKNVLNILFSATQQPKLNITTNYVHMTKNVLKYYLEPQKNSSATRRSDSHLFPAESKTISTTTNIVRDYLLYDEISSSLKNDKANISDTAKDDFTTLPYEEKNKATHSMKDVINIEENQKVTGQITSSVSVTTHNIKQISATEPTDTMTPIACNIKSHGKYPDENDCSKFYICIDKQSPIIGKCPIGTVFSDIKKQCTKKLSHCIRNNQFKCLVEGRFIDVLSNNYYYICAKNKNGFVRFKLKCQEGYYLNSNNVRCLLKEASFEDDSKNTSERGTKESISSERFQFKRSFNCLEEGKFEFPENCRKYYVCTKKSSEFRRRVKQCESDEVFDRDKKKCVDEESYECRL